MGDGDHRVDEPVEVAQWRMKRAASPEPKRRLLRPTRAAKMTRDQLKPSEPLTDNAPHVAASSVRLATAAARPNWNKVLVRPT